MRRKTRPRVSCHHKLRPMSSFHGGVWQKSGANRGRHWRTPNVRPLWRLRNNRGAMATIILGFFNLPLQKRSLPVPFGCDGSWTRRNSNRPRVPRPGTGGALRRPHGSPGDAKHCPKTPLCGSSIIVPRTRRSTKVVRRRSGAYRPARLWSGSASHRTGRCFASPGKRYASGTREYGAAQRSRGADSVRALHQNRPSKDRGRGESRVLAAPAASHAK